ncbi:MAG: hypothetical protein A4S09_08230 [Proteobacteria bacterium SG_bin7]|nr:MAG: hypothetical protein A4S09_08230 [Proteobacteria bacterium SG_bin7]
MKNSLLVAALATLMAVPAVAKVKTKHCDGGSQELCSDTAQLVISGVVLPICNIEVAATVAASSLNISGGESSTTIANVTEQSNVPTGYTVSVSSLNNGNLKHATVAGEQFAYQLSYDGGANFGPTTAPAVVKTSGALPGFTTDVSAVKISFPAQATAMVGTYSDTLSFTLQSL